MLTTKPVNDIVNKHLAAVICSIFQISLMHTHVMCRPLLSNTKMLQYTTLKGLDQFDIHALLKWKSPTSTRSEFGEMDTYWENVLNHIRSLLLVICAKSFRRKAWISGPFSDQFTKHFSFCPSVVLVKLLRITAGASASSRKLRCMSFQICQMILWMHCSEFAAQEYLPQVSKD